MNKLIFIVVLLLAGFLTSDVLAQYPRRPGPLARQQQAMRFQQNFYRNQFPSQFTRPYQNYNRPRYFVPQQRVIVVPQFYRYYPYRYYNRGFYVPWWMR